MDNLVNFLITMIYRKLKLINLTQVFFDLSNEFIMDNLVNFLIIIIYRKWKLSNLNTNKI